MSDTRLPWALGWASVGIGLTELAFAEGLAGVLGLPRRRTRWIRAFGVRELAAGVGLLRQPHRPEWVWARVAGDALDLAALASTFRRPQADARWRGALTATVVGATLVDLYAALRPVLARPASSEFPLDTGGPRESWRGSGLAEDVGAHVSPGEAPLSEKARRRMIKNAERQLGLPPVEERGPRR